MAKKKKGKVKAAKPLGRKAMAKAIQCVEEYLKNGRNRAQAYLKVFPGTKNPDVAATLGYRLFSNEQVAAYLTQREEELRAKYRLTTDDVMR